jgi:uncharacterized protein DUF5134
VAGPSWLSDTFAAVMLLIAVYCAARLAVAGAWRRESELDADGVHLLMGVAMAGTLVPALSFAPSGAWVAVFAAAAAWFAWQAARAWRGPGTGRWRCPYPVPHLAESLAMVYMLAAVRTSASGGTGTMPGMPAMGGPAGMARVPELAVIFTLFMVGYVAWLGDRLTLAAPAAPAAPPGAAGRLPVSAAPRGAARQAGGCWPMLAPRAAVCYKIAMGITMGYMLVIML